jgi:hypothetical protein
MALALGGRDLIFIVILDDIGNRRQKENPAPLYSSMFVTR